MPFDDAHLKVVLNKLLVFNMEKPEYASVATTLKDENPAGVDLRVGAPPGD